MKLGTIAIEGRSTLVVRMDDETAVSLSDLYQVASLGAAPPSILALIEAGPAELERVRAALNAAPAGVKKIDIRNADWQAPVTRPSKISRRRFQ